MYFVVITCGLWPLISSLAVPRHTEESGEVFRMAPEPLSYLKARSYCQRQGLHLFSPTSEKTTISAVKLLIQMKRVSVWLGFQKIHLGGWRPVKDVPADQVPQISGNGCARIRTQDQIVHGVPCHLPGSAYVCQISGAATCGPDTASEHCITIGSDSFWLRPSSNNWYNARENCARVGATLAVFRKDTLPQFLKRVKGLADSFPVIWFGQQKEEWQSNDNKATSPPDSLWGEHDPGSSEGECVVLKMFRGLRYIKMASCTDKNYFICSGSDQLVTPEVEYTFMTTARGLVLGRQGGVITTPEPSVKPTGCLGPWIILAVTVTILVTNFIIIAILCVVCIGRKLTIIAHCTDVQKEPLNREKQQRTVKTRHETRPDSYTTHSAGQWVRSAFNGNLDRLNNNDHEIYENVCFANVKVWVKRNKVYPSRKVFLHEAFNVVDEQETSSLLKNIYNTHQDSFIKQRHIHSPLLPQNNSARFHRACKFCKGCDRILPEIISECPALRTEQAGIKSFIMGISNFKKPGTLSIYSNGTLTPGSDLTFPERDNCTLKNEIKSKRHPGSIFEAAVSSIALLIVGNILRFFDALH